MVPMLTCGLVRSNFAFATVVLLRTFLCYAVRPGQDVARWGGFRWKRLRDVPQSLPAGLLDDLLGNGLGDLCVGVELHGEARATLRLGAQVADVAEHLGQRDEALDDLGAADVLHALDLATAGVDVTDDLAHVVLGRTDLDGHHRLEQDRVRLPDGLLEHHRAGDLERHLRGVDVVVGAVVERRTDTHERVAGEHAVLHGVLDTGVHRRDVLTRDTATGDTVDELVHRAVLGLAQRLEADLDLGELARATGLLLVRVVVLEDGTTDRLAVGHLRLADVGLDLELALHAVHEDVEVQLSHAGDDRLAGVLVVVDLEGRVLGRELLDGRAELLLVTLGLGLDGDLDHRVGEGHRLEHDLLVEVRQRVAGRRVLEPDSRVDVAGHGLLDGVLLVGVHLEELPDALLAALRRVDDARARADVARVDADEGQRAEERVRGDLEGESRERLVLAGCTRQLDGLVAGLVADHRGHVERRREIVDDGVEHRLHAAVLEGGATEHRVELGVDRELADAALDLLRGQLLAAEVLLHELVVGLGDALDECHAVLLGLGLQVRRDLGDLVLGTHGHVALGVAGPHEGTHVDEVDDTEEVVLGTDRELHDERLRAEAVLDRLHREVEVGAELVHLVDEADARHVVLVGLAPHRLGLGLDALLAVEHRDRAVEDAQRALDLDREVDVPGGVDDVDLVAVPGALRRGRRDGDAALLLLLHPVHRGRAVVDLTDLVVDTGVEEDALGRRGLARVDVRHDPDVAGLGELGLLGHLLLLFVSVPCAGSGGGPGVPPTAGAGELPAVVREGLVRLGHLVRVLAPLHGGTEAVARVEQLVHQALGHRLLATGPAVLDQPAETERGAARRADLDRDLVGRTTDAAAADPEGRLDVVQRALERHDR